MKRAHAVRCRTVSPRPARTALERGHGAAADVAAYLWEGADVGRCYYCNMPKDHVYRYTDSYSVGTRVRVPYIYIYMVAFLGVHVY